MNPRSIIVFDGVCILCNGWVRFVLERDADGRFVFAVMQTAAGRRLLQEHGLDPDAPASLLLLDEGVPYTDSTAILRVLARLGAGWKTVAGALSAVPLALRDPAYRWIARHRYRWFGRRATCVAPAPANARRFIR